MRTNDWKNNPEVLERQVKVLHIHDDAVQKNRMLMDGSRGPVIPRRGHLVATIAMVIGYNGQVHIGTCSVKKGDKAIKKIGHAIAVNRARLEFARVHNLTSRNSTESIERGEMQTAYAHEIEDLLTRMGLKVTDVCPIHSLNEINQRLDDQLKEAVSLMHDMQDRMEDMQKASEERLTLTNNVFEEVLNAEFSSNHVENAAE